MHTLLAFLVLIAALIALAYWLTIGAPSPLPALRTWFRHDPDDPYVPEAAEAPDPVDEHFKSSPRVVAGQDIDDSLLIAELQKAYADYRAGRDIFAGARHEPSPEVKQ